MPESTSFSIERPPTPVAWNTRHSNSSFRSAAIFCTAGVVTPNMVMPIAGQARACIAAAAVSRCVEARLDHAGERVGAVGEHLRARSS